MEEDIDESLMTKFVHKVFRKSNNIGSLTVKSVRQQFLEYLGLEKLMAEQKEVFKSIVHDIYNLYSNENQEQNGDQGSSSEDPHMTTETENVCDLVVSCSSASSRKKKRAKDAACHRGEISNHNNNMSEEEKLKGKTVSEKEDTTSRSADRMKEFPPPAADSIRLRNLKRFVRTCGLHKNYVKLFSECDSMSQREKTLERVLRKDTGFQGRITLSMCKKFKLAKEEADELAELDCNNIITANDGPCATRRTRAGLDNQLTTLTVLNSDSAKLFRRLKGVVDSDGSDTEEKQQTGKRALSTCPKKQYPQENSRKRRRLNSSSDEDGY